MKGIKADRIKIKVGNLWESPILHILLTKEDDIIVARCLEFTVSSHGRDEKGALESLADSVKEYVLTAVENDAIDTIFDSANSKYWRMFNELEASQSRRKIKRSLKQSFKSVSNETIQKSTAEVNYA
ncbi:MAG: hypothetical protein JRI94_18885 [Deltaproteobacteria bacterium]|nr:hypothetical protein [Deltaproteobacteria bacterium]MBW2118873.1 hypothetical protein [Deltaproteobacteria bacterium]